MISVMVKCILCWNVIIGMIIMSLFIYINIIIKICWRYDMIKIIIKKLIEYSIYMIFKLLLKLLNKNLIYFESFYGK